MMLRETIWTALHPHSEMIDVTRCGGDVAAEILDILDRKLAEELPDVRKVCLSDVYERVAGRLVALAS